MDETSFESESPEAEPSSEDSVIDDRPKSWFEDTVIANFSGLLRGTSRRGSHFINCQIDQLNPRGSPLYSGCLYITDCKFSNLDRIADLRLEGLDVRNQKFESGFTEKLSVRGIMTLEECDHRASCIVAGVTKSSWLSYRNCHESVLDYSVDRRIESVTIKSVLANPVRLPSSYQLTAQRIRLEHVIVQYPVCPMIVEAEAIFIIGMPLPEAHRLAAETKGKVFWGRKRNRIK